METLYRSRKVYRNSAFSPVFAAETWNKVLHVIFQEKHLVLDGWFEDNIRKTFHPNYIQYIMQL